jgi:hypothetical protein
MVNDPTELSRIRRDVLALRDFCIQKASKTSMLSLPRTPALPTNSEFQKKKKKKNAQREERKKK